MATGLQDSGVYYPNPSLGAFRPKYGPYTFAPTNTKPVTTTNTTVPKVSPTPATPSPPQPIYLSIEEESTSTILTLKQLADDGVGGFAQDEATVNYTTGVVRFRPAEGFTSSEWDGNDGRWKNTSSTDTWADGSRVRVWYKADSVAPTAKSETLPPQTVELDLAPFTTARIVPGSVMFRFAGDLYVDRNGTLYRSLNPTNGAGMVAGEIDYNTGRVRLTDWPSGANTFELLSLLFVRGDWVTTEAFFRTAGSPVRPASFYVQAAALDGELVNGSSDVNGVITGNDTTGTIQQTMGIVSVQFAKPVAPNTLRYNAIILSNLPLEPSILGLDPVRLPSDGRVPIFRAGDVALFHHTDDTVLTNPVTAGATYSVGRTDCAMIELFDANDVAIASDRYAVNLVAGTVTLAADWTGAGVVQPLAARHRVEDLVLLSDVQINGTVQFTPALTHDYPAGSYVSSALLHGDMQAMVTNLFDQATWSGAWSDLLIGSQANAQYDDINYPVEVLNESAVTERWRLSFTSATAYQVVGENLGVIATGTTATDCAPINPITGDPYFVIRAAGFGAGWATGNQIRFNTIGAAAPIWVIRTLLAGATREGDVFELEGRGDVD